MNDETEQIFEEQLDILPSVVVDFISSTNWDADLDEIGSMYNLHEEELGNFKQEATLVLAGLVHPDEFRTALEQEVGLQGSVLDAVVDATEQRIFASIRPALMEFFDSETATENEEGGDAEAEASVGLDNQLLGASGEASATRIKASPQSPISENINSHLGGNEPLAPSLQTPRPPAPTPRTWEREPDIAPDNLPTDEEPESFLPPIPQKPPKADADVPSWDITPAHPFEEKMKKVFTAGQQSMGELTIEPATPQVAPPDTSRLAHDPYREPIE